MHQSSAYPLGTTSAILAPSHVAQLFPPQLILEWFESRQPGRRWRDRKLPRPVLFMAALLHAMNGQGNFAHALDDAACLLSPGSLGSGVSDGSVTPARTRLSHEVLACGRGHVVDLHAQVAPPSPLPPFRVLCIDGTTFSLADSPANADGFGYPACTRGRCGNPSLRACFTMDAASHLFVDAECGGYAHVSENELADRLIARTAAPGVLFELDRGFFGINRLQRIREAGAEAVCRVEKRIKLPVIKRLPDGSYLSVLRQNWRSRRKGPDPEDVAVRVICYDIADKDGARRSFRLVTTVTDWRLLPARQAAESYQLRWREEVGIRELKWMMRRFATPAFKGMSPGIVLQEFEAMLLAHASLRVLMACAGKEHGVDPTRLSLSGSVAVMGRFLRLAGLRSGPEEQAWLLSEIARQRLDRPNGRSCPRARKVKRSKHKTRQRGSPCTHYPAHTLHLTTP